jgi:hypothetical protein
MQREARTILRKLDRLVVSTTALDPPLPSLATDARDALERLAHQLTRQEHLLKAQTRDAARRRTR